MYGTLSFREKGSTCRFEATTFDKASASSHGFLARSFVDRLELVSRLRYHWSIGSCLNFFDN